MNNDVLVNRVEQSDLITIDPEKYYPKDSLVIFDFSDYLFKGLILRERDFREALKQYDWTSLQDRYLLVISGSDAIIPLWAYMLVGVHARPFATKILSGSKEDAINEIIFDGIKNEYPPDEIGDAKLVIKGCSKHNLGPELYLTISTYLQPHAKSIMFGEPCSTVPIFKKKRLSNK